jgi:hypothetical protein
MAAITRTATQIRMMDPPRSIVINSVAAEAIVAGDPVAPAAGGCQQADANAAGMRQQVIGIALNAASTGQAVAILNKGPLAGNDLSAVTVGDPVFVSDTQGGLDTATSATKNIKVGRCLVTSDKTLTKYLYVDCPLNVVY